MNEEEITRYDEKILFEELSKDKLRRSNILINLNVSLQNIQRITANIKDFRELQEYKIAVVSVENELKELQQENQQLKEQLQQKEDIINEITNYCKFQIEKEQDKFPKPIESEEWLKGRISSFEEILDNKGE